MSRRKYRRHISRYQERQWFFNNTPIKQVTHKNRQTVLHKTMIFLHSEGNNRVKRQLVKWDKIFIKHSAVLFLSFTWIPWLASSVHMFIRYVIYWLFYWNVFFNTVSLDFVYLILTLVITVTCKILLIMRHA